MAIGLFYDGVVNYASGNIKPKFDDLLTELGVGVVGAIKKPRDAEAILRCTRENA